MFIIMAIAAYLLGSIPFGLVLTRYAGLGDIRNIGSGNIGATNVLRTGNRRLAAATLLLDIAKGTVAVLIGRAFGPDLAVVAGGAAILGHLFPVWLRFRGGKGVATSLGVLLGLSPLLGLLTAATWLATAYRFRYSSLAALAAAAAAPFYAWLLLDCQASAFVVLVAILIAFRHEANIRRLLAGQESRIELSRGA